MSIPEKDVTKDEAKKTASDLFGIKGFIKKLPGEWDQNFYIKDDKDKEFVLKISRPNENKELLDLQNKALDYLAAHSKEDLFQSVCPSSSGNQISTIKDKKGNHRFVRLLTYIPGLLMSNLSPPRLELFYDLGKKLGKMDKILEGFSHPFSRRDLEWDLRKALFIKEHLHKIPDGKKRKIVEKFVHDFETFVVPLFPELRKSVIYNDANDHNIIVKNSWPEPQTIVGIVDFGDMVTTFTICEIAVAAAYAMMGKENPLETAVSLIRGYNEKFPLTEAELKVLFLFIAMRLCVSVTLSSIRKKSHPDNPYLTISEKPAWELLEQLSRWDKNFTFYAFRHACSRDPCPESSGVINWLKDNKDKIVPILGYRLKPKEIKVLDLSPGSVDFDGSIFFERPFCKEEKISEIISSHKAAVGIGRYGESRIGCLRETTMDQTNSISGAVHLGIDLFAESGTRIYSPLDGKIVSFTSNDESPEKPPSLILKHVFENNSVQFYSLYRNLSKESFKGFSTGRDIKKGEKIGVIANPLPSQGNFSCLHFQLILDPLGYGADFPGECFQNEKEIWKGICPDANFVLGIPQEYFPRKKMTVEEILEARDKHIGRSLSISYKKPLKMVRGYRQYLYDETGKAYLDAVNNVPHVGHSHPAVVRAAKKQMEVLNTNTRYLHDNLVQYAKRLCDTMPEPLKVCFFVNSGSEANELAIRMARTHTKNKDFIVVDHAYHGNTNSVIEISPYKFDGPGGFKPPPYIHKVVMPDVYRGPYRANDKKAGEKYAEDINRVIKEMNQKGCSPAALFHESLMGVGGQIILPPGYLKKAYLYARKEGGICVADEVQVGMGRVGSSFWAFELQGVIPDIVTIGKPVGNGHPLGAVVTTEEIAASFDNGMEYFNTFGGNPVSCAVGMAVLDVIREEKLQQNALKTGEKLRKSLEKLKEKHPLIGDVRGVGLFIGIELVLDRKTLEPAPSQAFYIIERMKEEGILISVDGPLHNVLKIKPPLVFNEENADHFISTLDRIMSESFLQ
ncbi:MAG: aminotransferase class III-fold pyridoxal phosphate-dependent enzyme [Candidatus Aminicenantaceae bacterium]